MKVAGEILQIWRLQEGVQQSPPVRGCAVGLCHKKADKLGYYKELEVWLP